MYIPRERCREGVYSPGGIPGVYIGIPASLLVYMPAVYMPVLQCGLDEVNRFYSPDDENSLNILSFEESRSWEQFLRKC